MLCGRPVKEWILGTRPLVLWIWLMGTLPAGHDPEPVAMFLTVAVLLFAAARWSATVRRESLAALVLFDAPALFSLTRVQAWPMGISVMLIGTALLAGLVFLSRRVRVSS